MPDSPSRSVRPPPAPLPSVQGGAGPISGNDVLWAELRSLRDYTTDHNEFIERILLEKISSAEKLTAQQVTAKDSALALQAREYERRLEALNHEHEKIQQRDAEFVRKTEHNNLSEKVTLSDRELIRQNGTISSLQSDISALESTVTWLSRLLIGSVLTGIIAFAIQSVLRP